MNQNRLNRSKYSCCAAYIYYIVSLKKPNIKHTFMQNCHEVWKWKRVRCSLAQSIHLPHQPIATSKMEKNSIPHYNKFNIVCFVAAEIKSRIKFKHESVVLLELTRTNMETMQFFYLYLPISIIEPSWDWDWECECQCAYVCVLRYTTS